MLPNSAMAHADWRITLHVTIRGGGACSDATARLLMNLLSLMLSSGATTTPISAAHCASREAARACNGSPAHRSVAQTQWWRYGSHGYAHDIARGHDRWHACAARQRLDCAKIGCRSCSAAALWLMPRSILHTAIGDAMGVRRGGGLDCALICFCSYAALALWRTPMRTSHCTRPSEAAPRAYSKATARLGIARSLLMRSRGAMAHANTHSTLHIAIIGGTLGVQRGNGSTAH